MCWAEKGEVRDDLGVCWERLTLSVGLGKGSPRKWHFSWCLKGEQSWRRRCIMDRQQREQTPWGERETSTVIRNLKSLVCDSFLYSSYLFCFHGNKIPYGSFRCTSKHQAVYCHPAYLAYMQRTSFEMLDWMNQDCNNLRYADDTTLMAQGEEELKSLLMRVKEENEKKNRLKIQY